MPELRRAEGQVRQAERQGGRADRASRFTNSLYMQLHVLLEQVMDVAEDGIDDNLDPSCVKIFDRAFEQARDLHS